MKWLPFVLLMSMACDVGGTDPGPGPGAGDAVDAGRAPDARVSENALGQTCAAQGECPSDPPHQCVFLQSGNPELGYCSPTCGADADCAADYTGPATGTPTCFVPDYAQACSILCDDDGDCPSGLECKITGGPVNVCATL